MPPIPLWRLVFIPNVVLSFAEGLLVPVLPLYLAALGVPFWWIGLVLAGESIGMIISDLPAGALLRRMNRRGAMVGGIALMGVAALLAAFAQTAGLLFVLRLLAGLGAAVWGISRHAYLTDAVPRQHRGRVIAAFGGSQRFGSLFGPVVGGSLAVAFGFSAPFIVYAGVAFAMLLVVASVRGEEVVVAARASSVAASGDLPTAGSVAPMNPWQQIAALGSGLLAAAGLGVWMAAAVRAGRRVVIPLYGATVLGLDAQAVGLIVSMAALVDVALFPLAGLLMDRLGRKHAIIPSFALQSVGMLLVPLTGSFVGLAAAAALIGFGNGIGSGTMMTVGADLAPEGAVGEFLGAWRLIGDAGAMGSPVLVGSLADVLGLSGATMVVAVSGFIAALAFAFGVPETGQARGRSTTVG
jgi:MFS family permease